jgi:hypothetical protein
LSLLSDSVTMKAPAPASASISLASSAVTAMSLPVPLFREASWTEALTSP